MPTGRRFGRARHYRSKPLHELITIDITTGKPIGLGEKRYAQLPRVGEWVEMDDEDGKGTVFEVVMVAHSTDGHGCDLYVRRLGLTVDQIRTLCAPRP